jgi:hypothetical protein
MHEHETPLANLVISISVFHFTCIWSIPKLSNIFYRKKILCFYGQFNNRCHNISRYFNETFVKLCHTIEYLNLLWVFRWWPDGHNFCLIVASIVLWCAHVLLIYWTFFHLKLQRFTFSGILWIFYCCHLALFYLWYHHMLGFCNLFCNTMCEVWIRWTIIDCCNLPLIITSNVCGAPMCPPSIGHFATISCKISLLLA